MNKTIIATAIVLCGAISFFACGTDDSSQDQQELSLTQESAASAETEHIVDEPTQTKTSIAKMEPTTNEAPNYSIMKKKVDRDSIAGKENAPRKSKEDKAIDIKQGKTLIGAADCFACHKKEEKLVGPSYTEVAKKYVVNEQNMEQLANKIKEGGAGVWGAVPMSPHPSLSKSDARKMVAYILSLRP